MSDDSNRNRRREDMEDSINRLYLQANTPEAKETMGVFRQICEDIRQISEILIQVAATNNAESAKVAKMLERLEQRMTDHENLFRDKVQRDDIRNAEVSTRDSIIKWALGIIGSGALLMSGTVFYKLFDVADLFTHVAQIDKDMLVEHETLLDHSKRLYNLEMNMRISAVEQAVVEVKKNNSKIMNKKIFKAMKNVGEK